MEKKLSTNKTDFLRFFTKNEPNKDLHIISFFLLFIKVITKRKKVIPYLEYYSTEQQLILRSSIRPLATPSSLTPNLNPSTSTASN